jgi:isopenicillin-N epimerase
MSNEMKKCFLLDPGVVFLNHGSFGACPREVLEAQHRWQVEMERNPVEFLDRRGSALQEKARAKLAVCLGARLDDLVFITNATHGANVAAISAGLQKGDEVLTTSHEYGACLNAWSRECDKKGVDMVRLHVDLPFDPAGFIEGFMARVTPNTKAVFLSHITSCSALIMPVQEICRRLRDLPFPVMSVVDGAHAPGQIQLNLEEIGADIYFGNCHKWMCSPKGSAFLYARPEHHATLDSTIISWGYSDDLSGHEGYTGTKPFIRRHQYLGTRDISAFLAVPFPEMRNGING